MVNRIKLVKLTAWDDMNNRETGIVYINSSEFVSLYRAVRATSTTIKTMAGSWSVRETPDEIYAMINGKRFGEQTVG